MLIVHLLVASKVARYRALRRAVSLGNTLFCRYTGVWFNERTGKWEAMINLKKIRYHLGPFDNIGEAINIRRKAEQEIHDPMISRHLERLTPNRRKEFLSYLEQNK